MKDFTMFRWSMISCYGAYIYSTFPTPNSRQVNKPSHFHFTLLPFLPALIYSPYNLVQSIHPLHPTSFSSPPLDSSFIPPIYLPRLHDQVLAGSQQER